MAPPRGESLSDSKPPTAFAGRGVMASAGLVLLALLACARAAAILAPPVLPLVGDAPGYVNRALYIARTGLLPPANLQPNGFPLLMSPLALLAGERLPHAMRLVHVAVDLTVVGLLLYLVGRLFAGPRWGPLRFLVRAAILFQPFTAMFATLVYTETMVALLVFAGVYLLASLAQERGRWIRLFAGTAVLALAGTCRIDLAPFALLLPAWAVYRSRSPASRSAAWRPAAVVSMSFLLVFGGFVTYQFLSTGDTALVTTRFYTPGYMRWLRTWVVHQRETEAFAFTISRPVGSRFLLSEYPDRAFDDATEKERVAATLEVLSRDGYTQGVDVAFERLGRAKASAHPLRTWIQLPLRRAAGYWVNLQGAQTYLRAVELPRVLRWPLIAAVMALKSAIFALAAAGTFLCFRGAALYQPRDALLGELCSVLVLLRVGELTVLGTVAWAGLMETRYVLILWAPLMALAAIGLSGLIRRRETAAH